MKNIDNQTLHLMGTNKNARLSTPLYTAKQVYQIEQQWFDKGNLSYGLMQQAAWQVAKKLYKYMLSTKTTDSNCDSDLHACIWVGAGNNGGDGWLVASYLSQLSQVNQRTIKVTVIEVGDASTDDAQSAKKDALNQDNILVIDFKQFYNESDDLFAKQSVYADIYVDALFGIGLDRPPKNNYANAINCINQCSKKWQIPIAAIDVPSGLVVDAGHIFNGLAVRADFTLCLVARKIGLHIKDGQDCAGVVMDIPLIPTVLNHPPAAMLYHSAQPLPQRMNNAHKGSFGEVLIVGGNQIEGSQGMGGATILAASSAFAVGVGKLTVACHKAFHASLITSVPHAMSIDLHDNNGVKHLLKQCDVMAIGMGLGRDKLSQDLFYDYLQSAMDAGIDIVIDADGLYHLADLVQQDNTLKQQLTDYAHQYNISYTPHSGEAARLLNREVNEIEADRLAAIQCLFEDYGGNWLLKGNGSLTIDEHNQYVCVCNAGNAGMSTAGMGDVLSGVVAGLNAQTALPKECFSLQQAVMVHALAGDKLAERVGEWATQASDMPYEIGKVMQDLTLLPQTLLPR